MGCHGLPQVIFPTQGSNLSLLGLLHCRQILYPLSHLGSPRLGIFSCSIAKLCLTLQPHGLQHSRLPYLSLLHCLRVCLCPLSWRCYLTISSSATPFFCSLQSFPASGSFPMNQLFTSDGQSIRGSALVSVIPMSIQGWFPLGLTGLISLQSKGLSRVFCSTTIQKHKFFDAQPFFMVQLSLPHKTTGKIIALTIWTFVTK